MKSKKLIYILVFLFIIPLIHTVYAKEVISDRTGEIRIAMPDGTVATLEQGDALPVIPSGLSVKLLSGVIVDAPEEGYIDVICGDTIATVRSGQNIVVKNCEKKKITHGNVRWVQQDQGLYKAGISYKGY